MAVSMAIAGTEKINALAFSLPSSIAAIKYTVVPNVIDPTDTRKKFIQKILSWEKM